MQYQNADNLYVEDLGKGIPVVSIPAYLNAAITCWANISAYHDDEGALRIDHSKTLVPGIFGAPGLAKTASVHALRRMLAELLSRELGEDLTEGDIGVLIINPADRDGTEAAGVGVPFKNQNTGEIEFQFSRSPWHLEVSKVLESHKFMILLVDELSAAADDVQKVLAQLFHERRLGSHSLDDRVFMATTGNTAKDKSGSKRLLAHLANRIARFIVKFDIAAWLSWANDNGIFQPIVDVVSQYWDKGLLAEAVPLEDVPICTPRTMEKASNLLQAHYRHNPLTEPMPVWLVAAVQGLVGYNAAMLIKQAMDTVAMQVPRPEVIIANPDTAEIPADYGIQSLAGSTAIWSVTNSAEAEAVLTYLMRDGFREDLLIYLGRDLRRVMMSPRIKDKVAESPIWRRFVMKFHQYADLM